MSRRSLKSSSSGTLTSGKRKIQEKLRALDEENGFLITSISSSVEKAKDAGTRLLQEGHRDLFFSRYRSVSEQLQHSIDSLYLLRATFLDGSEEEEEDNGSPDGEASGPVTGGHPERGDEASRRLKSRGGILSLGKKRIQEKMRTLDEDRDLLVALINNFVHKPKDVGTQLLQEEHRNTFFNQFKSVSKELQDCTDSLYLLRTTFIEGSDDEGDASDLEGGDERTPRTSSVASPTFYSEDIQNTVHEFSSIDGSMHSLCSNQTSLLDGTKNANTTISPSYTQQRHTSEFQNVSTSPEIDSRRHSIAETCSDVLLFKLERNSFSSCQEVKPCLETQNLSNKAALKDQKCYYRGVFPGHSTACSSIEPVSPVNKVKPLVSPSDIPSECKAENLADQSANDSSSSHPNDSELAASYFQPVKPTVDFLPVKLTVESLTISKSTHIAAAPLSNSDQQSSRISSECVPIPLVDHDGSVTQPLVASRYVLTHRKAENTAILGASVGNEHVPTERVPIPLVDRDGSVTQESQPLVASRYVLTHRKAENTEIIGASVGNEHIPTERVPIPLVDRDRTVVQESKPLVASHDVLTHRKAENTAILGASVGNEPIGFDQELKPTVEPCELPYISELGILHVPSSNISHQNIQCLDAQLPEHNDLISFLIELKQPTEAHNVTCRSEKGTIPVLTPRTPSNQNIHCPDTHFPEHNDLITFSEELKLSTEPHNVPCKLEKGAVPVPSPNASSSQNIHSNSSQTCDVQYVPDVGAFCRSSDCISTNSIRKSESSMSFHSNSSEKTCVVQYMSDVGDYRHSSDNISTSSIHKSESSMSLPLPEPSGFSPSREPEIPTTHVPLTNNFTEVIPKENRLELFNLDDFSLKGQQAESMCSSSRSSFYSALAPDSNEQSFSSEDSSVCENPQREDTVIATDRRHIIHTSKIVNTTQIIKRPAVTTVDVHPNVARGIVERDRGDHTLVKQQLNSELELPSRALQQEKPNLSFQRTPSSSFTEDNNASIVNYLQEVFDLSMNHLTDTSTTNIPLEGTDDSSKSSYRSMSSVNIADDSEQTYYSDDEMSEDMVTIIDATSNLLPLESPASNTSTPEPAVGSEPSGLSHLQDSLDVTLVKAAESSESKQLQRSQVCFIPAPCFITETEVMVRVLATTSPSDFYLQLIDNDGLLYRLRQLRTDQFLAKRLTQPLTVDMCCLVMTPDKADWLRGKITRIVSEEYVEIALVDFGQKENYHVSDIFEMNPSLTAYPALAVHCFLKGVEPVGKEWSQEAIAHFKYAREKTCTCYFHNLKVDGKQAVNLRFAAGGCTYDLALYMITGEWVKPSSSVHGSVTHSETAASSGNQDNEHTESGFKGSSTQMSSLSLAGDSPCSSSSVSPNGAPAEQQNGLSSVKYQWVANVRPCQVTPDDKGQISVVLSVNISPSEFYVNVVNDLSFVLDELQEEMNKFYKNHQVPDIPEDLVNVGSYWCTRYAIDKSWYRVRIVQVIPARNVGQTEKRYKIQYIDYGNIEDVGLRDLKPLTLEFTSIPAFATRCSLACIQPIEGASWSREAIQRFKTLTGYEKMFIGEIPKGQHYTSSVLSLLLFDLEISEDLTLSLNDILVKEELAVVVQLNEHCVESDEVVGQVTVNHEELGVMAKELKKEYDLNEDNELAEWDPMTSDFVSLRNSYNVDIDDAGVATVGYKAKDERRICRYFDRNGRCRDDEFCPYLHIKHTSDGITRDSVDESIQWNIMRLPSENDFVFVQISCVFNPSHFYVLLPFGTTHAASINEILEEQYTLEDHDELNDLLDEMSDHYSKKTFSENFTLAPALGSLVAVRSEKENQWYRGRVCVVDEEAEKVKVFFIDAGHEEFVPRRNVQKLQPQFCHLPSQAVECFMDVQPANGDTWSKESCQYFKELTVGKILLAEVIIATKTCMSVDLTCIDLDGEEIKVTSFLVAKNVAVIPKKKAEFPFQDTRDRIVYLPG